MPCTTILVGRNASNDHSTMISRTDDGRYDVKKMIVVQPKDQKKTYKSVLTRCTVELPEKPMRYTAIPSGEKGDRSGTSGTMFPFALRKWISDRLGNAA